MRQSKSYLQARDVSTLLVGLYASQCRFIIINLFLFEFLRVSGEGRLISDLSVQRRHAVQQRVACRLANISAPPATRSSNEIQQQKEDYQQEEEQVNDNNANNKEPSTLVGKNETIITLQEENISNSVDFCENDDKTMTRICLSNINETVAIRDPLPELRTFDGIHRSNSTSLHQRIVEGMIESNVLDVPLPIVVSNYECGHSVSDTPKCLMENNGGRFD